MFKNKNVECKATPIINGFHSDYNFIFYNLCIKRIIRLKETVVCDKY